MQAYQKHMEAENIPVGQNWRNVANKTVIVIITIGCNIK